MLSGDLTLQFMGAQLVSHLSMSSDNKDFKSIQDIERLDLDLYVKDGNAMYDSFAK